MQLGIKMKGIELFFIFFYHIFRVEQSLKSTMNGRLLRLLYSIKGIFYGLSDMEI